MKTAILPVQRCKGAFDRGGFTCALGAQRTALAMTALSRGIHAAPMVGIKYRQTRLGVSTIEAVLEGIDALERTYLKKATSK